MATPSASLQRYRQRQQLVGAISAEGARTWRQVDPSDITGSWRSLAPRLVAALSGAQLAAARGADEAVSAELSEQGIDRDPTGEVAPRRLAGTASDGRTLDTLLDQPRLTTLHSLRLGAPTSRALASGQAELDMILKTEVADAGRVSDGISIAARPGVGYVRMIQGKTCGRCVVLSGKFFRYNKGFQRHPSCDCIHIPSQEASSGDLTTDPRSYFDTLDGRDQNRLFGAANSKAIRDGADPAKVINATSRSRKNGMYTTADGRKATLEGTGRVRTRRPGGRGSWVRLVPEEIYKIAPSRRDAIDMLRLHGYLI